jgi:hypothetical protein
MTNCSLQIALGSISAKIDLAYRLTLVDEPLADVLHCLRKMRNEYAHVAYPGDLSIGEQGKSFAKAISIFRNQDSIWWDDLGADRMAFRSMYFHVVLKLAIGIQPDRKPDFPILLKASLPEQKFFEEFSSGMERRVPWWATLAGFCETPPGRGKFRAPLTSRLLRLAEPRSDTAAAKSVENRLTVPLRSYS